MKATQLDETEGLVGVGHRCRWQLSKKFERGFAVGQAAAGDLTDDERVHQHLPAFEQIDQFEVCSAKVIDPYRGVDQNRRLVFSRRRGATVSDG